MAHYLFKKEEKDEETKSYQETKSTSISRREETARDALEDFTIVSILFPGSPTPAPSPVARRRKARWLVYAPSLRVRSSL
jgi:hypothetical protein